MAIQNSFGKHILNFVKHNFEVRWKLFFEFSENSGCGGSAMDAFQQKVLIEVEQKYPQFPLASKIRREDYFTVLTSIYKKYKNYL